jgi:hypothetical protein
MPLSEDRCNKLTAELSKLLPLVASVDILGLAQLSELGTRWHSVTEEHYRGEIDACLKVLAEGDEENPSDRGLLLALSTVGHKSSTDIRDAIYESSILNLLRDGIKRGPGKIAADISSALRLQRSVPEDVLVPHLSKLAAKGLLNQTDQGQYLVNERGLKEWEAKTTHAVDSLLLGRTRVREYLEDSLGHRFADEQFSEIWKAFEDQIAQCFYERGQQMVAALSLAAGGSSQSEGSNQDSGAHFYAIEVANAVAATSALAAQADELKTAVLDMFSDREGPTADWLLAVCSGYVSACSLGLESSLGEALSKLVAKLGLVLDTDVALSLLCDGEPDHQAVKAIVSRWKSLRGKIFCARPVMHEIAYHAGIAENDFNEVSGWLPGTEEERNRLIENAFVRAFAHLMSKGQAKKGQWMRYIKTYKGSDRRDISPIRAVFVDLKIADLPAPSSLEASLQQNVYAFVSAEANKHHSGTELRNALDKAQRDAELYASMVRKIRVMREEDPTACCLLVSSARRLLQVESTFGESGEPHFVVPISTILHILSLIPNVSLGLSSLKAYLFDQRRVRFTSDLERKLLRIIHDSKEYEIAWARRGSLTRELRSKLLEEAKYSGAAETPEQANAFANREAFDQKHIRRTSELIRESLDAIAVDTRTEEENRALRNRVTALEAENQRLKMEKARMPQRQS